MLGEQELLYGDYDSGIPVIDMSAPATPLAPGRPASVRDPADRADKGPNNWWEDPVPWLTAAFAIGAGIIGFRFHWGPGARVSASVDIADEISELLGTVLLAIAGIATFKLIVFRFVKVPAAQEFAKFL